MIWIDAEDGSVLVQLLYSCCITYHFFFFRMYIHLVIQCIFRHSEGDVIHSIYADDDDVI